MKKKEMLEKEIALLLEIAENIGDSLSIEDENLKDLKLATLGLFISRKTKELLVELDNM